MPELGVQKSPQGIAALSMGNPAPLQQRVQQGGKDPQTGLPKDLVDALALNIVTHEQDAAKRQMAMQQLQQAAGPTGQMPTVVQSLQQQAQQKMAAAQQHAIQQAQAQQAAQGQGIDQAPIEFGLAEGGIVAFAKGGGGEYETPYDRMNRENREAVPETELESLLQAKARYEAARSDTSGIDQAIAHLRGNMGRGNVNPAPAVPEDAVQRGRPTMVNDPRMAALSQPAPTMGGIRSGAPVSGAPDAGLRAAAAAPRETMDPMEKAIRDNIMATMGRSEDTEYSKGIDRFNKTVGIDALLKDMSDRAAAREARFEQAKAERMPDWVKGLQAMSGAPVRGGIGMLLGQMGGAAAHAREAYGAEDIAFSKEIDALRDVVTKAKIEGNVKAANAGEQALKDLIANKRQAEQSGTSLLNTQEQTRTRRQMAADAAAARAIQQKDVDTQRKMANATQAIARDELINKWQKDAEAYNKVPTESSRALASQVEQKIADRQKAIYKQFGVLAPEDTIKPAPGASQSPGGTRPPLSSFQR